MNMKRQLLFLSLCFALAAGSSWASIVGSTSPGNVVDSVDWCQFGCTGAQLATPQPWTSAGGQTGLVGLFDTAQGFYNLQQGTSWFGNFTSGMGLVYNGGAGDFGNTPTDISVTFDEAQYGVGAYIQADFYGPFAATITLYDASYQLLGSFSANGTSDGNPGTALFIGASDPINPAWAAQFDVVDQFGNDDIAIGTVLMSTPEPESLLLMGSALLGLAAFICRRSLKSEVK